MSEDYVSDQPEEGYDYTAADRVPTGGNPLGSTSASVGDDEGFSTEFRPDVSPEEIEKGSFRFIGPGDHTVYIKDVQWAEDGKMVFEKVYIKQPNGEVRPMSMDCKKVKVIFAIPGDENCTASDMFLMPPVPSQMEAYEFGYGDSQGKGFKGATDNPREKGGFHAKKLKHFLGRLFTFDSSGRIPAAAGKFANWKKYPGTNIHKLIGITIKKGQAGGTYVDKKTGEKKESQGFNNIVLFTYRFIEPPAEVKVAQQHAELLRQKAANPPPVADKPQVKEETSSEENPSGDKPAAKSAKSKKVAAHA